MDKLRERFARGIYTDWNKDGEISWEDLPEHRKDCYRGWVDTEIITLFRQHYKAEGDHLSELISDVVRLEKELKKPRQHTKIKLPENPYGDRLAHELWLAFNEALQQVKELNKEVEE